MKPLSIAILGTRGIPAAYGGFETFAEELSTRLVARGHAVVVYGRRPFFSGSTRQEPHRGVTRRNTPTLHGKYLETPLHALTSFVDVVRGKGPDVALLCNAANSPFAFLLRLKGIPLAINVDGIERERKKWNSLGRLWYRLGEQCSVWFGTRVVADAQVIATYYRERFKRESTVIAYGAEPRLEPPGETLEKFGLRPGNFLLYVSRLEPENNALGVLRAYNSLDTPMPLVIVGDAPYAVQYKKALRREASAKVVFTGFQFGQAYRELRTHCHAYIQATEVGGTHPALLEAMAFGNCILANRVPEHEEVLGDAGLYYAKNNFAELSGLIQKVLSEPATVNALRERARDRAAKLYRWETVVDHYEALFAEMA